jgi:hypothetical protein
MVSVVPLLPEFGVTDSQLFTLLAEALKFTLAGALTVTFWVTCVPPAVPLSVTELGDVVRPGVEPGASTVTGMVRLRLPAVVDVRTMLPVLNPGPKALELMPTAIEVGVVEAGDEKLTKLGTEETVNGN